MAQQWQKMTMVPMVAAILYYLRALTKREVMLFAFVRLVKLELVGLNSR